MARRNPRLTHGGGEAALTASSENPSAPNPAPGPSAHPAPAKPVASAPPVSAPDAAVPDSSASPNLDQPPVVDAPDGAGSDDVPKDAAAEDQQHPDAGGADPGAAPDVALPLGPGLDEFIAGLPGSAMRVGSLSSILLGQGSPVGARAALAASADPPGFAWKFADIDATTCKIVGYTLNGIEPPIKNGTGDPSKVTVRGGTVHVPAISPANGKTVVGIEKNAARIGSGYYQYLQCGIDFSQAVNLKSIGSAKNFDFADSGLTGTIDLSKCTQLTDILAGAFSGSASITSLVLPPNLQRINGGAFQKLSALGAPLTIPTSVTKIDYSAFQDCALTSLQFAPGSKLTTLGDSAFKGNHIAGTFSIPPSLASIAPNAFQGNQITGLQFAPNSKLWEIRDNAFLNNQITGTLSLPDSVTKIGISSFANNKITEVRFGKNSVNLGNSCFEGNKIAHDPLKGYAFSFLGTRCFARNEIESIDFGTDTNTVTGSELVADNPNLSSVVLSPSWLKIADKLFSGDKNLVSVSFPSGITGEPLHRPALKAIGAEAFKGCSALASIDFKDAPLHDESPNLAIGAGAFQGCSKLEEVILGKYPPILGFGVPSWNYTVGQDAFQGCTALKTALIPPKPVFGSVFYHIGDRAFKDTDLGDYAKSDGAIPGVPLGTLPLVGREIKDIGAQAYTNSNLKDVWLPSTLTKVGNEAFADNQMGSLELPRNAALDNPGAVGANILARQTVEGSAFYGDVAGSKANVMLKGIRASFGVDTSHMTSLGVKVGGSGSAIAPDNTDWKVTDKAAFNLSDLQASNSSLAYDLDVWRAGGSGPLSTGDVTVPKIEEGVPFEFRFYNDAGFSSLDSSFTQWTAEGAHPEEMLNDVPNFGTAKPGYRTQSGAYDPTANAGWRWASPPNAGTTVDPASVVGEKGATPAFYNRWLANSYSVKFDDNFAYMFEVDNTLGTPNPDKKESFLPQPNPDLIWGSLPDKANLTFGTAAPLPKNQPPGSAEDPQGGGFKMGGYQFVGWATSPNLAQSDRIPGKNFFADGAQISTPDPAPDNGGTVTLYAQWQARSLTDDPVVNGSIMIPARIQMQQDGAHLWSKSPDPQDLLGFTGSLPPDAVPIWAMQGGPGASWPEGISYDVFVKRAASDGALLTLSSIAPDGTVDAHAVDVLEAKDGIPYNPGPDAANPVTPLFTLSPRNDAQVSGVFFLRTQDKPWDFLPNVSYAGTMTFVLKQAGS